MNVAGGFSPALSLVELDAIAEAHIRFSRAITPVRACGIEGFGIVGGGDIHSSALASLPTNIASSFAFQGRFLYQSWDLEVPFELQGGKPKKDDLPKLVAAFRAIHERIYAIKDKGDVVAFTTWKSRAMGDTGGADRKAPLLPRQQGKPAMVESA